MSSEIYVSTDVEADGPIPGPHSMLSFASAAYTENKKLIATHGVADRVTLHGAIALRQQLPQQLAAVQNIALIAGDEIAHRNLPLAAIGLPDGADAVERGG